MYNIYVCIRTYTNIVYMFLIGDFNFDHFVKVVSSRFFHGEVTF